MKTMKIIKKAVAILSAGLFIGSSILGASAMSYPDQFIQDGQFNGNLVVGANAQPSDIIGSVDIMSSLQYAVKRPTNINIGSQDPTVTAGYKVAKSGNNFNYGDTIADVMDGTSLTEDDLPAVLSDGKYVDTEGDNKNSITYTQELKFLDTNAEFVYDQDDHSAPVAGDYLKITEGDDLYKYTLEMDSPIQYNEHDALDDWKTTTFNIQGRTYTVSDVSPDDSSGTLDKITLISGEAVMWLTQNNPIKKTIGGISHDIEVLDVTEDADACQVKVDGQTVIIDIDNTKTINGVQVGVTDVRAIHAQLQDVDVCQLALGASEITLQDGKEVKVDDVSMDGTEVNFGSYDEVDDDYDPWNVGEFEGFSITYSPENMDDDLYLSSKNTALNPNSFTDPVFNSWKIVNGGLTADYNEYSVKTSGDHDATFKFISEDNKKVELPLFLNETGTVLIGESSDPDERYYWEGTTNNVCTGISDINDCEGMKIIATASNEPHIFEISNIDYGSSKNTTDIKDITYGREYNNVEFKDSTNSILSVGSFGSLTLNINEIAKTVTVVDSIDDSIKLKDKEILTIDSTSPNVIFSLTEGDSSISTANILDIKIQQHSTTDNTIEAITTTYDVYPNSLGNLIGSPDWSSSPLSEDSSYTVEVSPIGTKVTTHDDKNSVVVNSPSGDNEVYGNVFVTQTSSDLTTSVSGQTYTINKIGVGSSKLDTEITDVGSQNIVSVGGPCANSVTAKILGKTYATGNCAEGFSSNTAMIKAIQQINGKVAIVVAGYDAMDTRRASKVLAQYDIYNLSLTPGSSYTITGTGTDLTNINVVKSS